MTWTEFLRLEQRYALPKARVVHGCEPQRHEMTSQMREIRTSGSVGAPGEQSPGATRPKDVRPQRRERGADLVRIGAYVRCWQRWARSGLRGLGVDLAARAVAGVGR